jgi:hypothetical protein
MKILSSGHRLATVLSIATGLSFIGSNVALGEEVPPAVPEAPAAVTATTETAQPVATTGPNKFVSDGQVIPFNDLKMNFAPIQGWEVLTGSTGLTLMMQEPNITPFKINNEEIKFQRNMTIVARHAPTPIDQQSIDEFRAELTEKMTKDTMVSGFQIIESKLFNYRGQNDGILIYASMKLGAAQVMQAHVRVSGANNSFWLSYTDLAERFSADQESFKRVWQSMNSINVEGVPVQRYMDLIIYGSAGLVTILFFSTIALWRRRRAGRMYESLANSVYDDDGEVGSFNTASNSGVTQSDVWALTGTAKLVNASNDSDDHNSSEDGNGGGWQVSSVTNF